MKAPDFKLLDQDGVTHSLTDYRGQWLVLYFYPKDDTPGCTTEACAFRDSLAGFKERNVAVLGVSADSVKSHKKFAKKYNLNFPLLSDESKAIIEAYGVWGPKKLFGKEFDGIIRSTFLINPEGEIAKEYPKVTPQEHAEEILKDLELLMSS